VEARVFRIRGGPGEHRLPDGRVLVVTERWLDQTPGRILVLQDVTEARSLQERLERQERLSAMGEMAAKLAHQIRTPLSSALLYVGHLSRPDLAPEQRATFAARLRDRLQHMERQASEILAFSGGQGARFQSLDISELVGATVAALRPLAAERGADLSFSDRGGAKVHILGNADALQGAFANLISNALEHGARGVCVSVDPSPRGDRTVVVRCRDDGPGVPEEIRAQVFDPFFTTRSDGTGLGLAVVQSVVLAHRGGVRLDADTPEGACFEVELPVEEGPPMRGPHRNSEE
jgi:two-component system sensor histidine kinase FlrB